MCTLTLHRRAQKTIVTMNRDELRARPEGATRQATSPHGIEYLFPSDTVSGGTWLGINARGVGGCLLNRYGDTHLNDTSEIVSRGTIIPGLLECRNLQEAYRLVDRLPLHRYRNFDLLLFDDSITLQCTHENGTGSVQRRTDDWLMLTSSSWNKTAVLEYRQRKFEEYVSSSVSCPDIAESVLRDFHLADADDSRFAVFMRRAESHTKSISQILLDSNSVSLRYLDEKTLLTFDKGDHYESAN